MLENPAYRYEELAAFITGLVHSGTLRAGARVPSLREISKQRQISLSSALQAYRLLEDRGHEPVHERYHRESDAILPVAELISFKKASRELFAEVREDGRWVVTFPDEHRLHGWQARRQRFED